MESIVSRLQQIKDTDPPKYSRLCHRLMQPRLHPPPRFSPLKGHGQTAAFFQTLQTFDISNRHFWMDIARSWEQRPDEEPPPGANASHISRPSFSLLKDLVTAPRPDDVFARLCMFNHPWKILRVILQNKTPRNVLFLLRKKFGLTFPDFLRLKSEGNLQGLTAFKKNQEALDELQNSLEVAGTFVTTTSHENIGDLSQEILETPKRHPRRSSIVETILFPDDVPQPEQTPQTFHSSMVSEQQEDPAVRLAKERLERLRVIFEESDMDDEPGLDIGEFKLAMRRISGDAMTEREIALVFMKVDANCDGNVDWNEFLDYTLREYQEQDAMSQVAREMYLEPAAVVKYQGTKQIKAVVWSPQAAAASESTIDWVSGRYYSVTAEGIVQCWTLDLAPNGDPMYLIPEFRSAGCHEKVTDMVCIPEIRALGIGFATGLIKLYYYDEARLERVCTIYGMPAPPECMHYVFREYLGILFFADAVGGLFAVKFPNLFYDGFWTSAGVSQRSSNLVAWADLRKAGKCMEINRVTVAAQNPVLQIRFCLDINAVIVATNEPVHSLILFPVQSHRPPLYIANAPNGFNCFDYQPAVHLIATGSSDRSLKLWQPDKLTTPTATFAVHTASVDQVRIVHEAHFVAVVTVDALRTIRVFNVRENALWQEIPSPVGNFRKVMIGTLFYNPVGRHFVYGGCELLTIERLVHRRQRDILVKTHDLPVVAALYNDLFDCVVTGCEGSTIMVWNFQNGHKIIHFANAHVEDGIMGTQPVPIRNMTFDSNQRRLLTVGEDGLTKMWNFNNGACLSTFDQGAGKPLSAVQYHRNRDLVVAGGCGQRVVMVRDTRGDDDVEATEYKFPVIHRTDITDIRIRYKKTLQTTSDESISMSGSSSLDSKLADDESQLISVSFDGEIVVWDVFTGTPLRFLNTDGSITAFTPSERNLHVSPYILGVPHIPRLQPESSSISDFLQFIHSPLKVRKINRRSVRDDIPVDFNTGEKTPSLAAASGEAVSCMIHLSARSTHPKTATILTASLDGFIRGWSDRGLCAVFHGGKTAHHYIRCMTTDPENELLFTGDNAGYMTVYLLCDWANGDLSDHHHNFDPRPFPAIRQYKTFAPILAHLRNRLMQEVLPKLDSRHRAYFSMPIILNVYRAHLSAIQHITVIPQRQVVITSSRDCSVRLWTFGGLYIGTLGQSEPLFIDISTDVPPVPHYNFTSAQNQDEHAVFEEIFAEDTMDEIILKPRAIVPQDLAERASALTLQVIQDMKNSDLPQPQVQKSEETNRMVTVPKDGNEDPEPFPVEDDLAVYRNFTVKSLENLGNLENLVPECIYNYNVEKVQNDFIDRLALWQRPEFLKAQREGTLHGDKMRELVRVVHARHMQHIAKKSRFDVGHVKKTLARMGSTGRQTLVDFLLEPDASEFVGTLLTMQSSSTEVVSQEERRTTTAVPVVSGNMEMLTDIQAVEKTARRKKRPVQPVELVLTANKEETRRLKENSTWMNSRSGKIMY
ncbi:WD repeat-containing protein on Y chromosome-like [Paramacrobiotus metropolitanus]|uniref:WD repeat-containing protein on Y chromosome-like n=1 Tax=Paramacrobiotus metropolitanus TaxID=2943436 RepID=UPI002445F02F|nr:WD repeat-containing protein on Y chromosome-like [Paramacrobiotus metropolitanus]